MGINTAVVDTIISGRGKGPYRDAIDFFTRTDIIKIIGRNSVEILIDSGVLDSLGADYREYLREFLK
jgi:DNA polymerase III alpha subunit